MKKSGKNDQNLHVMGPQGHSLPRKIVGDDTNDMSCDGVLFQNLLAISITIGGGNGSVFLVVRINSKNKN